VCRMRRRHSGSLPVERHRRVLAHWVSALRRLSQRARRHRFHVLHSRRSYPLQTGLHPVSSSKKKNRNHCSNCSGPKGTRPIFSAAGPFRPSEKRAISMQWRIQQLRKWGTGRKTLYINLVVIYRKCTRRTICLLHGKRRLIEKNLSQ